VTKRPVVKLFGRVRLSPFQHKVWLTLAGATPGGVTTVDQLLQWVRARKAEIAAQEPEARRADRLACLDALFEWSTGVDMPDPPADVPRNSTAVRSVGALTCHAGGRVDLEREWFALVMTGQGDSTRANSIRQLLGRRSSLTPMPESGPVPTAGR
jgi:hypothetical protein